MRGVGGGGPADPDGARRDPLDRRRRAADRRRHGVPRMTRVVELPRAADLAAAERAVRAVLPPTPVVEALGMCLKLETMQPTGSFKVRGGVAALAARPADDRVVTASAGNHGLGGAYPAA